ncbi:MAG: isocitrate lyase/phosphoenolpyruvate mutase family protein [Nisaea sp.]|nr:isocitrate lyase/phosphoenolpyruvate mutase family protein [Nisaea sp.]MEC7972274.1 isocitrate lyase/phosphoenolpyruvate mutase family protein [Pseudomonadota bacterium]|tara:strand:+ start:134 stop:1006 length:873 start_codon:yes stop_codon:yes gene_type:complete
MINNLKQRLSDDKITVAPGIYDALSGLLVEQAGFSTAYLSGASLAYTRFGRPDIGLIGMREVADTVTVIRERIDIELVVDGDTGYGNALNVIRTVKEFERAGASAIQLEDQDLPKRCGHLNGKSLVSDMEMVGKLKAAVDTRLDENTLIIARTDAIAVEGFDSALDRAERYLEAGADVLFIEAPENRSQMEKMNVQFKGRAPLLANMVEGGKTPVSGAEDLEKLGYSIVIFPGGTVRAVSFAMQEYMGQLKKTGSTDLWRNRMFDFRGFNDLIGTPEMLATGERYADPKD